MFYCACAKFGMRFTSKINRQVCRQTAQKKKIATTLICYTRLTQCSKPVKNRKKPVFWIYLSRFLDGFEWLSVEATFTRQLTQRKCSLCSQGMSRQVASINISANQNAGFVMEYQVHNPFNQHFWKFCLKWNSSFWFSPTEIFGIACEGGPLWLRGLVWMKFPVPFGQIVVSENCLFVSRSQYHWHGKQLILFWKCHLQFNCRRLRSFVHKVRQLLVPDCTRNVSNVFATFL